MFETDLASWMQSQRWFVSSDRAETIRIRGRWVLAAGDPRVEIALVESGTTTYIVPLVVTTSTFDHPLITKHKGSYVYDATDLKYGQAVLLEACSAQWLEGTGDCGTMTGRSEAGTTSITASAKLTGEQSNTSIRYTLANGQQVILKVFRVLNAGLNPDVILTKALADAGSPHVAPPTGSALATWQEGDHEVTGHILVAQEFMAGATDAWQVMTEQAAGGTLNEQSIRALGTATQSIHDTLADVMPTNPVEDADRQNLVGSWRRRALQAISDEPRLESRRNEIEAVFTAAEQQANWPDLQRIHGDYHLGQVLDVPERGWIILDFEGEPLRPLDERTAPDLALRDVAGMLRSFDYVGGQLVSEGTDHGHASAWVEKAQSAFLDGYGEIPAGTEALLTALELDKALYEVSYEVAHRPSWVDVPVSGVNAILNRSDVAAVTAAATATDEHQDATDKRQDVADKHRAASADRRATTAGTNADGPAQKRSGPSGKHSAGEISEHATDAEDSACEDNEQSISPALVSPVTPVSNDAPLSATTNGSGDKLGHRKNGNPVPDSPSEGDLDGLALEHQVKEVIMELEPVEVSQDNLAAVAYGDYHAPHDVLGPHLGEDSVTIRVIRHLATGVTIVTEDREYEAVHEYNGVWVAVVPGTEIPDYRVRAEYSEDLVTTTDDPYRFLPTVGEFDLYLFGEGRHEELWRVLGSHLKEYESVLGTTRGTSFSVWAPNARAVRVVGDFNHWNGKAHAMRSLGASGVWELFIPDAAEGQAYKYEIQYQDGSWHQKADPMARRTEKPPLTASVITKARFKWDDDKWITKRETTNPLEGPISIYEVHLGSWRQDLNFKELAEQLIGHVKYLGFTHVELMPIAEHPYGPSWGYQVTSYYAPTARFGEPDEFRYLINELHNAGIGVIMDWVPAHFPKDAWALANFDGTHLYEDPDPRRGEHPDWGTLIFNYGRHEVRNFLVANALYWIDEYHIDGIRVDAVASLLYLDYSREDGQWSPNIYGGRENLEAISFMQETNATAYRNHPGILMIAEESTSWPGVTNMTENGGLGFGLKWNMGWMNDTLRYLAEEPINRRYHHGEITFSLVYAFSEQFMLPLSHDEVVHGKGSLYSKMPGDDWQKRAGVRALFAYQWAHPGKQLIFMGQEFAQTGEWDESKGLDWWLTENKNHDQVMSLVAELNKVYLDTPALWSDDFTNHGFEWIEVSDGDHNVLSFIRKSKDEKDWLAVVVNFAGTPHENYRVGLPFSGTWEEVLNTDDLAWGGSGVTNGTVETDPIGWNGRAQSAALRVPPLGAVWLKPTKITTI